nr:putative retrotransposon RIRE1 poly protein [Tanacetum cinerariifolium]
MMNDDMDMIDMVSDVSAMISEVNLFKSKNEVIDKFVLHKTKVENQLGKKIKVVRSDMGGEYVSPFVELCAKHGIRHELIAPYSPQQNGIDERKNRTLKEMVTAMLISSAKVAVPAPKAQKIGPKSVDCIFIRYAKNNSAYRFIVYEEKNLDIQKNTVMESRNASFFEHIFSCLSKETRSSSRLDEEGFHDKRQRDDNNLQDEIQDQTEEKEGEAIKSEKDSILQNYMWELMDLPHGCKPLGYKWIFKKKMKADGTIEKCKARLVIKGFRQHEGEVGSYGGNGGREGFMFVKGGRGGTIAEIGGGSLTKRSMESNNSLCGGGFVVVGESGEECLDGWVGAGGGEVKGGGVVFGVSRILLGVIPRDIMGESGGKAFGLDGGAD